MYRYLFLLLIFVPSCVSPKAVDAKIGAIDNRMDNLEKIVDQHANTINNSLYNKTNIADKIYGGGGWVTLVAFISMFMFYLLIRYFMGFYKTQNSLRLVGTAIKNLDDETARKVKRQIENETNNGGPFTNKDKIKLRKFLEQNHLFVQNK